MGAAYAVCQALLGHELEDVFLSGRLCLYSALAAPRDNPAEWLDMAASFMTEALDKSPGDAVVLHWQQKVAKVQSKLKPVEEEEEDRGGSVKSKSRRDAKGKTPSLLTGVSALSINDPGLTTDGAVDVKPGQSEEKMQQEPTKQKQSLLDANSAQAQIDKRIQDQKYRQKLSRVPPAQRRAAANRSFALGEGSIGTIKKVPSRLALRDLFNKQKTAEETKTMDGAAEELSKPREEEQVQQPAAGAASEAPKDREESTTEEEFEEEDSKEDSDTTEEEEVPSGPASPSSEGSGSYGDAAAMGGVINEREDEAGMRFNFAEQYAAWKAEAGEVSQAEYDELYAQHLKEMEAYEQSKRDKLEQQKESEKDEDVEMKERSLTWE